MSVVALLAATPSRWGYWTLKGKQELKKVDEGDLKNGERRKSEDRVGARINHLLVFGRSPRTKWTLRFEHSSCLLRYSDQVQSSLRTFLPSHVLDRTRCSLTLA